MMMPSVTTDNEIILTSNPGLPLRLSCPRCKDKFNKIVEVQTVKCGKCQLIFKPDLDTSIADMYAHHILRKISDHNIIKIYSATHLEKEIYYLYRMFVNQGCWEVNEPKRVERVNVKARCKVCGFCKGCVTCVSCGVQYKMESPKTKCPKCGGRKTRQTYIPEIPYRTECVVCHAKVEEGLTHCPECGSDRVKPSPYCPHCDSYKIEFTAFRNKTKCPLCGGKKITERKKHHNYELVISRIKAFRVENIKRIE